MSDERDLFPNMKEKKDEDVIEKHWPALKLFIVFQCNRQGWIQITEIEKVITAYVDAMKKGHTEQQLMELAKERNNKLPDRSKL